jgi:acetate kinase
MRVLVLNVGSGSQKVTLFEFAASLAGDAPVPARWSAKIDSTDPDQPEGSLVGRIRRGAEKFERLLRRDVDLDQRVRAICAWLWDPGVGAVQGPDEIDWVAHRVVHGGAKFTGPVRLDEGVIEEIERLAAYAPLHNPPQLVCIRATRTVFGEAKPMAAVFDTAFHRPLPAAAAAYGGPRDWIEQGLQRYGFHGSSFRYANRRAREMMDLGPGADLRLVICHLGGGCSLAAVRNGRSIDTTMGFTPLDGLVMCTRSGALDPGLLIYLLRQGTTVDQLEKILNKESGLAGLSELPGDTRVLVRAAAEGNEKASFALDVFVHRLRSGIGSMIASLGGIDALVFTDVIGETDSLIRARACADFQFLGIQLDDARNREAAGDCEISQPGSRVRVLVIASQEDWQVARECVELGTGGRQ